MNLIKQLLKNKKVITSLYSFITITLIVIFMAILSVINRNNTKQGLEIETDPASGEKIAYTGYTSPNSDGILWLGYEELNKKGMSNSMILDIKKIIREYALHDWNTELKRVSLYKNSYSFTNSEDLSPSYYNLRFALNTDKKDIFIKILTYGYNNYEIIIYSDKESTNRERSLKYCSVLICKPEAPKTNGPSLDNYAG